MLSFAQADESFGELMEEVVDLLKELRGREQIRDECVAGAKGWLASANEPARALLDDLFKHKVTD